MAPFAQALEHRQSVHVRQTEIQKHDVGMARRNLRQTVTAALVVENAVMILFEHDAQQTADFALVVDHQSGRMLAHRKPSKTCAWRISTGMRNTNSVPPVGRVR